MDKITVEVFRIITPYKSLLKEIVGNFNSKVIKMTETSKKVEQF